MTRILEVSFLDWGRISDPTRDQLPPFFLSKKVVEKDDNDNDTKDSFVVNISFSQGCYDPGWELNAFIGLRNFTSY